MTNFSNPTGKLTITQAAVGRLDQLSRADIRKRFELRFSATAMARRYLDLYARLADAHRPCEELAAIG